MRRIVLLSCTSKKKSYKCEAKEMYQESAMFRRAYQYAKMIGDMVLILSAKYGVLQEEDVIEPYNLTLNDQNVEYRRTWSINVINQLSHLCDLHSDQFIILTGRKYYEYLLADIHNYDMPLEGKSLGYWIPALEALIANSNKSVDAKMLHELFCSLLQYNHSNINDVPFTNGIYVMFDNYEKYDNHIRIVRIGTHTAQGNLISRLKNHFKSTNQRSSIFRKNIGRCILNIQNSPYLSTWNLDRMGESADRVYEKEIEKRITDYLSDHITFTCFQVEDKTLRLRLEDGIISSISNDADFKAPDTWLGNSSPIVDIRNSGLWCVHGVKAKPLDYNEFLIIKGLLKGEKHKLDVETAKVVEPKRVNPNKPTINRTAKSKSKAEFVRQYLAQKIDTAFACGESYIDIVSGDIHRELGMKHQMPTVCGAMYKLKKPEDEILHTTKSGFSSTIKIRYKNRN